MVRREVLGLEGTPFELPVERGKIREFARATQSEAPAYLEHPEPVMPPTFLTVAGWFWQTGTADVGTQVGADPDRVLHAGQEYVFHGPPPRAGTALTGQARVSDIYEKEGRRGGTMTFFTITTEFRDTDGNLVAESSSTGVETARAVGGDQ